MIQHALYLFCEVFLFRVSITVMIKYVCTCNEPVDKLVYFYQIQIRVSFRNLMGGGGKGVVARGLNLGGVVNECG